jgi:hypothetical protein
MDQLPDRPAALHAAGKPWMSYHSWVDITTIQLGHVLGSLVPNVNPHQRSGVLLGGTITGPNLRRGG